jgi:ssRNA-specific RNase YbeY (16S rRNA maturation enzyme)
MLICNIVFSLLQIHEFRNKDVATDVLSFEEFLDDYLGDIIISIDIFNLNIFS